MRQRRGCARRLSMRSDGLVRIVNDRSQVPSKRETRGCKRLLLDHRVGVRLSAWPRTVPTFYSAQSGASRVHAACCDSDFLLYILPQPRSPPFLGWSGYFEECRSLRRVLCLCPLDFSVPLLFFAHWCPYPVVGRRNITPHGHRLTRVSFSPVTPRTASLRFSSPIVRAQSLSLTSEQPRAQATRSVPQSHSTCP